MLPDLLTSSSFFHSRDIFSEKRKVIEITKRRLTGMVIKRADLWIVVCQERCEGDNFFGHKSPSFSTFQEYPPFSIGVFFEWNIPTRFSILSSRATVNGGRNTYTSIVLYTIQHYNTIQLYRSRVKSGSKKGTGPPARSFAWRHKCAIVALLRVTLSVGP